MNFCDGKVAFKLKCYLGRINNSNWTGKEPRLSFCFAVLAHEWALFVIIICPIKNQKVASSSVK